MHVTRKLFYPLFYVSNFITFTAVLTVEFSKSTFSGTEATGVVTVTLSLGGGTSASIINVTVIPSDQSPSSDLSPPSARGKIMTYTD